MFHNDPSPYSSLNPREPETVVHETEQAVEHLDESERDSVECLERDSHQPFTTDPHSTPLKSQQGYSERDLGSRDEDQSYWDYHDTPAVESSAGLWDRIEHGSTSLKNMDEEQGYRGVHQDDNVELLSLIGKGNDDLYRDLTSTHDNPAHPYTYSYPPPPTRDPLPSVWFFATGIDRLAALFGIKIGRLPIEVAIERKRQGLGGQRFPVAAWGMAIGMTGLLIFELVRNYQAQGTPIAIHPNFNYMIGPSSEVLINVGARFVPCMKYVSELPPSYELACLNVTSSTSTSECTIEDICGHGGFPNDDPNQSWRFIYPIFLHVGIIHLVVNMLVQIYAGAQVEREMGTIPFLIVYIAGGIYGFVLGGNFARTGIPSVGASGALFATNACVLVDLVLHWKYEDRPKLKALILAVEFLLGVAVGYIPNAVDGLAHLGGFAMGLLTGIILYPSISETPKHRYIVWGCRVVAVPFIIVAFVLTIKNFYTADPVSGSRKSRTKTAECGVRMVPILVMHSDFIQRPLHRHRDHLNKLRHVKISLYRL